MQFITPKIVSSSHYRKLTSGSSTEAEGFLALSFSAYQSFTFTTGTQSENIPSWLPHIYRHLFLGDEQDG